MQVEERHRQRASLFRDTQAPHLNSRFVERLAMSYAEAEAAVQKWERGFLISCPWCGLATRGEPVSKQVSHLIECGDKRVADREQGVREEWASRFEARASDANGLAARRRAEGQMKKAAVWGAKAETFYVVAAALRAREPREGGQEGR
jgi:hypothetical protein